MPVQLPCVLERRFIGKHKSKKIRVPIDLLQGSSAELELSINIGK